MKNLLLAFTCLLSSAAIAQDPTVETAAKAEPVVELIRKKEAVVEVPTDTATADKKPEAEALNIGKIIEALLPI